MATTPAVQGPRTMWHVRGTWSARDDRTPSAVWLGILWLGMMVGFGVDFHRFLHENPAAPKILYVHGAVFTGWMLLLTMQVLLVLGDRVAWHRRMGWLLVGWACLMAVLGPWAFIASYVANVNNPANDPPFLSVNIIDIGGFLMVLAWGIALRKNPAAHRRMMILSTVAIADPGFARFTGYLWPNAPHSVVLWYFYTFCGNALLLALMAGWDWWRGRLMRSFAVAATGVLASEVIASMLYFWGPWRALTVAWVQAWAKHMG